MFLKQREHELLDCDMLPFSDPNDRPRSRIAAESLQNDRAEEEAALKEI